MKRLLIVLALLALPVKAAQEPDPPEIVMMKAAPPLIVNGIRVSPIVPFQISPFRIQWTKSFLELLP
jgi:hypothetical protein